MVILAIKFFYRFIYHVATYQFEVELHLNGSIPLSITLYESFLYLMKYKNFASNINQKSNKILNRDLKRHTNWITRSHKSFLNGTFWVLSITPLDFLLTNLFLTKTIVDKNAYQFWEEMKARYYDMTCHTFLKIYIKMNISLLILNLSYNLRLQNFKLLR